MFPNHLFASNNEGMEIGIARVNNARILTWEKYPSTQLGSVSHDVIANIVNIPNE